MGLLISTTLAANNNAAPVTLDGLHLLPDTKLGLVYADPQADLSGYDQLLLMNAQVAFRKNWRQETNRNRPFHVTASDMERIKNDVSELFHEIFSQELETAGFQLVTHQAANVLIIRPAILDLNVISPDTPRANTTRNLTQSAGDMTLYLELRDSVTGDILVKAMDFQFDRTNITPTMMDRTRNERAARRILTHWAQVLVKGLQEARIHTQGRQ
jgi:hypothetical protein